MNKGLRYHARRMHLQKDMGEPVEPYLCTNPMNADTEFWECQECIESNKWAWLWVKRPQDKQNKVVGTCIWKTDKDRRKLESLKRLTNNNWRKIFAAHGWKPK